MSEEANVAQAVVRAVDGDMLDLEVEQGCGRCHEAGGCGGQNLSRMFSGERHYRLLNTVGAVVGDRVSIAIASGTVRRSANLAYGLPLLTLFGGAALGNLLSGDGGAMLGAAFGLFAGFFFLVRRSSRSMDVLTPHIVARLPANPEKCSR